MKLCGAVACCHLGNVTTSFRFLVPVSSGTKIKAIRRLHPNDLSLPSVRVEYHHRSLSFWLSTNFCLVIGEHVDRVSWMFVQHHTAEIHGLAAVVVGEVKWFGVQSYPL